MNVIETLPHSVDAEGCHTYASSIVGYHNGRRQTRSEIIGAVDCNGIYLYKLSPLRRISSYVVSPFTYFVTAPSSIVHTFSTSKGDQRYTYAAVRERALTSPHRILRFAEETTNTSRESVSWSPAGQQCQILCLQIISDSYVEGTGEASHLVIVITSQGTIYCLDASLKHLWTIELSSVLAEPEVNLKSTKQIKHAWFTEHMTKPLLGEVTLLTSENDAKIASKQVHRQLHTLEIVPERSLADTKSYKATVSWTSIIPQPSHMMRKANSTSFHLKTDQGSLYQMGGGNLAAYSLDGGQLTLKAMIKSKELPVRSVLALHPDLLLVESSHTFVVYDLHYQSIHHTTRKLPRQKTGELVDSGSVKASQRTQFISFLPQQGVVIGLQNKNIVEIPLGNASALGKRKRPTTLLDSINSGVRLHEISARPILYALDEKDGAQTGQSSVHTDKEGLRTTMTALHRSSSACNISEYEGLLASVLEIAIEPHLLDTGKQTTGTKHLATGNAEPSLVDNLMKSLGSKSGEEKLLGSKEQASDNIWRLPDQISSLKRQNDMIYGLHALRSIFAWRKEPSTEQELPHGGLEAPIYIRFFPPNVFQWLIRSAYLTSDLLQKALPCDDTDQSNIRITDTDIVGALVDFDPDLLLVHDLFIHPCFLTVAGVTFAVQALIRKLESMPILQSSDHGETPVTQETDMQSEISGQEEAAYSDISQAMSSLDHTIAIHGQTLRRAITQLHCFPLKDVSRSLRTRLSMQEIIFLIQILRIELIDGGWTARYIHNSPPPYIGASSDAAMALIADLLSTTLDAVGVNGWLGGYSNEEGVGDEILSSLRSEVSSSLEGIHEATFMSALFDRFLLHSSKAKNSQSLTKVGSERMQTVDFHPTSTKSVLLPLSLNFGNASVVKKSGSRGEIKVKSRREIGRDKSMKVGLYTFERLRV